MQNIEAILNELGVEVPEDKKADLNKKVSENYVTKAEHDKKISRAESDRDTWKEKAEAAEETLKGFEGIDPAQVQTEIAQWKQKAEDAEKDRDAKIRERDIRDKVNEKLSAVKMKDDMKDFVYEEIMKTGVDLNKNGELIGFDEGLKSVQEKRPSAFVDEAQEHARQNAAHFTTPAGKQTPPGTMTRKDIEGIKDASERQAAIAQNLHLFGKSE